MPVYEYECKTCNKIFEVQQKMSDAPLSKCPECNSEVKKLISMNSFQLKGGGWYADGYTSTSGGEGSGSQGGGACPAGGGCPSCPAAQS